jgi:predicted dehydrogenase
MTNSTGRIARVAVIGFGYWGPNWANTIAGYSEATLCLIVERDAYRRALAETQYPSAKVTSVIEPADFGEIDLAIVATPPAAHGECLLALTETPCRRVIVEKPVGIGYPETLSLLNLASQAGIALMVDYTFLETPAFDVLSRELENLGEIEFVNGARHNLGIFRPDTSVLWDLTVHDLSIVDSLFQLRSDLEISCSAVRALRSTHPSVATIQIRGTDFPFVSIATSWVSPAKIRTMSFHARAGMALWDDLSMNEPVRVFSAESSSSQDALLDYRLAEIRSPLVSGPSALTRKLRLALGDDHERIAREDAIRSTHVAAFLDAAERSCREEGRYCRPEYAETHRESRWG